MPGPLDLDPAITAPDDFYECLIAAHRDLSDAESAMLNARLILLLANQLGDTDILKAAIAKAREGVMPPQDKER